MDYRGGKGMVETMKDTDASLADSAVKNHRSESVLAKVTDGKISTDRNCNEIQMHQSEPQKVHRQDKIVSKKKDQRQQDTNFTDSNKTGGRFLPFIHPPPGFNQPNHRPKGTVIEDYQKWTRVSMETSERRRIFFAGDSDDDDVFDDMFTARKKTARCWRYPPTGRKGLDRFRRLVDFILIARKLFSVGRQPMFTNDESILFFLDVPSVTVCTSTTTPRSPPLFHSTPYKDIQQKQVAAAIKQVLTTASSSRTPDQVTGFVQSLQTYSTFSSYPTRVQEQIGARGWYCRFETMKVLCRQGRPAEVFYLILSGVALSRTAVESDDHRDLRRQKAVFLRKGDTIGESELQSDSSRGSTVITREPVEVLGLDKKDYTDIFKAVMDQNAECLHFLRTVDVFALFPLDLLKIHQFACSVHNYRKGSVIVSNSNESEWVYVLKSGSCQVYKGVKTKPKSIRRKHPNKSYASENDLRSDVTVGSFLPHIQGVTQPSQTKTPREKQDSTSLLHLPKIALGDEKKLVGRMCPTSDSGYCSTQSDDEILAQRKKHIRQAKLSGKLSDSTPDKSSSTTHFAKLETLERRGVFGLHSILYDDTPKLTLVSNGTDCVLVSKRFITDHLDSTILNILKIKIPPYPSLTHIQSALDDKVNWDAYKQKVINDAMK